MVAGPRLFSQVLMNDKVLENKGGMRRNGR